MTKYNRALNQNELLKIVNNSRGITIEILHRLLGDNKSMYKVLKGYVDKDLVAKVRLNNENVYLKKDVEIDFNKVLELKNLSLVVKKLHDLDFKINNVELNSLENQALYLSTFINIDSKYYSYKFRVIDVDLAKIETLELVQSDCLNVLVVDDLDVVKALLNKFNIKELNNVLVFVKATSDIYSFVNSKLKAIESSEVFYSCFTKNRALLKAEVDYYNRLYVLKEQNLRKYSRKGEQ